VLRQHQHVVAVGGCGRVQSPQWDFQPVLSPLCSLCPAIPTVLVFWSTLLGYSPDSRVVRGFNQWRRNEFESGVTGPAQSAEKNFFVVPLHFFGSKSTIGSFGARFCDGQYSLARFLFSVLLLTVPRAWPFVKVGARAPRALWSLRQWVQPNPWTTLFERA